MGIGLILGVLGQGAYVVLRSPFVEIILTTLAAAAVPACLMEGLGPVASLKRSLDLTRGSRLKILLLVSLVYGVNDWVIYRFIGDFLWNLTSWNWLPLNLALNLFYSATLLFIYLAYAAVYYELRTIEELSDSGGQAGA